MRRISYKIHEARLRAQLGEVVVLPGTSLEEAIGEAVMEALSTDIEVTAGGKTMHLAAWMDPGHWSSDWEDAGVEEPYDFIAGLVEEA